MNKTRWRQELRELPEPLALTTDQLKEIVTANAGGVFQASSALLIHAGPLPPAAAMSKPMELAAAPSVQLAFSATAVG